MLTTKLINQMLNTQSIKSEVNTKNSLFLQNLASGKKMFAEIYSPKHIVDYASKLELFLNSRGAKILKVDRVSLAIKTSIGVIWFCVGSQNYINSNLYRDNFLRGRRDFVEILEWENSNEPTR